jgi:hypothetical protein
MKTARILILQLCVLIWSVSTPANALNFGTSLDGGLVQQPTSQYFHAGYGVSLWAATTSARFGLRATYFERPKFRSNSFEDQDRGGAFLAYGSIWSKSRLRLLAGAGFGRFNGYVRPQTTSSEFETRNYGIPGAVVWAQLTQNFGPLQLGLSHWTLAGYAGQEQFDALVVWPFSVFSFSIGWSV